LIQLDSLWWLLCLLGPLVFVQRQVHREIQAVFLLLTRRLEISLALFSLLFFPGVLLHELSHYLVARLLGVRTGKFSLLPRTMEDGRLQLGFVETAKTDLVRDALIGAAPLIAGGAFIGYAGWVQLGIPGIWESFVAGTRDGWLPVISELLNKPDFWLWVYLTFTVSSTMFPSSSDRRAWLPITLIAIVLFALALLAGAGPWMLAHLAPQLNKSLRVVVIIFGTSLVVQMVLAVPFILLRRLMTWLTGTRVV
jgi:hypothetical protein